MYQRFLVSTIDAIAFSLGVKYTGNILNRLTNISPIDVETAHFNQTF